METRIAKIVSFVFHPLLLPLYLLVIILHLNTLHVYIIPDNAKWLITGMLALASVAFPLMLMLLMFRRGMFNTIKLEQKEERRYPYILMAVIYYVMYLVFKSVHLPSIIINLQLGIFILIMLTLFINFWWKISIHMAGIGGVAGTLIGIAFRYMLDLQIMIAVSIFVAGIVGFARLKLNSHKPPEVYSGFLMGVAVMLLLYILN
jgi:hypothetical protein